MYNARHLPQGWRAFPLGRTGVEFLVPDNGGPGVQLKELPMAKIWYVREGGDRTAGDDLPLEQCIELLGLAKNLPRSDLDRPPRFDGVRSDLPRDPRYVFCEISGQEASPYGWRPGFYRLEISPKEVAKRLAPPGAG